MAPLIFLLRAFVLVFGITPPRPEQERRLALILLGVLGLLILAVVGISTLILGGIGRSMAK